MSLSRWEQATLNFYDWDNRGRGYYFSENLVSIEPYYVPFRHTSGSYIESIDDGKIPNLLEQFTGLFEKKKPPPKKKEPAKILFNPAPNIILNVGFSLEFNEGQEISNLVSTEFLNMLSFSEAPISFEIIGTSERIYIQMVCSEKDKARIESHVLAYFPAAIIRDIDIRDLGFDFNQQVAICDFGLNDELARPIEVSKSFEIDPLTSIFATFENLQFDDRIVLQVIFKGVTSPWAKDIPYSVSDGAGENFFSNSPEMMDCAKEKVSAPLFSSIIRIAAQGNTQDKSKYLATQVSKSITFISTSDYNKLIPLSNKGYEYDDHLFNLYHRTSNRLGMILNSKELATFVHYPNKSIISSKFGLIGGTSKKAPSDLLFQKYVLGNNIHNGLEQKVTIGDEARLKHTHIIGVTGVGKSTLIANMMLEDIKHGNGCALFDPHGDIVEDILARIPESRKDDIILIDPSDLEFPIGFNLLQASTDLEKIVLSSDLVSAFKRHATAWGDNMTAVLSNAINAFLESSRGGTLIELKRFLLEDKFRNEFLRTIEDRSIHYYWNHEYPLMKKGITPLLTRIDTFLRPKIIRHMLVQKSGIDFGHCIEQKKILLIKLSQGLIGQENSYLLGSLFLSKINQVVLSRQSISKEARHPYYLFIDEFEAFITPSIVSILSGARKYGLGLILAHQELAQIEEPKVLNSVISNPHTRICFRLGDYDAQRLEGGFSYFEREDLQNLGVGEAIVRVGSSNNDFNLKTSQLPGIDQSISEDVEKYIVNSTRKKYATSLSEIQSMLKKLLPKGGGESEDTTYIQKENISTKKRSSKSPHQATDDVKQIKGVGKYQSLQNYVSALAIQRGFTTSLDTTTETGGRVDIEIQNDSVKVAIEISETNSTEHEVENIQKCIDAGFTYVYILSENRVHQKNIKNHANGVIEKEDFERIRFLIPLALASGLDELSEKERPDTVPVRGYRLNSEVSEKEKQELIKFEAESIDLRVHLQLQTMIKKLGQERNFIATIEKPTPDGGRIDVVLQNDLLQIAFEISETNKPAYEVQNISKCLKANCDKVIVVSKNKKHLNAIERLAKEKLSKKDISLVKFIQPNEVTSLLDDLMTQPEPKEERVKGFRVITEFEEGKTENSNTIKSRIAKLLKNKKNRHK